MRGRSHDVGAPTHLSFPAQLFDLTGQVAIVTGGAGRLGSEYVRVLTAAGARVAAFDLPSRTAPSTGGALAIAVDIVDRLAVEAAVKQVAVELGTPTILVNNAGMGSSPADAALETGPFEDYPEAAWDTMIDSHLKGAFFVSQAFIRAYRAGRVGAQAAASSTCRPPTAS